MENFRGARRISEGALSGARSRKCPGSSRSRGSSLTKALREKGGKLKRPVSDLTLDKHILQESPRKEL